MAGGTPFHGATVASLILELLEVTRKRWLFPVTAGSWATVRTRRATTMDSWSPTVAACRTSLPCSIHPAQDGLWQPLVESTINTGLLVGGSHLTALATHICLNPKGSNFVFRCRSDRGIGPEIGN